VQLVLEVLYIELPHRVTDTDWGGEDTSVHNQPRLGAWWAPEPSNAIRRRNGGGLRGPPPRAASTW
jgi:hypothetical protein